MKLKLEKQDYGTILSVTESIGPEQVAVIKAGLAQVFQSTDQPLLIDLCTLPDPELRTERLGSEILALKAWSACQGHELFVAAPVPALGDAPTLEAGLALLASPPARAAALEAACSLYAEKLERQRHAQEKKLAALETSASSLRKLRKENSDLRKRIAFAESQIRSWVTHRNPAGAYEENAARLRTAEKTLTTVLENQGLLERGAP